MTITQITPPSAAQDQERDINGVQGRASASYSIGAGDVVAVLGILTDGTFDPATEEAALKTAIGNIATVSVVGPDIVMGGTPAQIEANVVTPDSMKLWLRSELTISGSSGGSIVPMSAFERRIGLRDITTVVDKQWLSVVVKLTGMPADAAAVAATTNAVEAIAKLNVCKMLCVIEVDADVVNAACNVESRLLLLPNEE